MRHSYTRGVALITAMLVVSLASILAISLVDHLNFDTQRTSNLFRLDQAQLINRGSVDISRSLLYRDRNGYAKLHAGNEYDNQADLDNFNTFMGSIPIEGGSVSTSIADRQACFNLNSLSQDRHEAQYRRLLNALGIDGNLQPVLVDSLRDWIDGDIGSRPSGAEFDYYLGQDPAYQTADSLLTSISELRLIRGYTADIITTLKPHICVLPSVDSAININTASIEVIESIDGLTGQGAGISRYREDNTFETLQQFQTYVTSTLNITPFNAEGIQPYSEYFLLRSETTLGNNSTVLYSIIFRNQLDGNTSIIRQTRGEL